MLYVWVGFLWVLVPPSPNSHVLDEMVPVELSVQITVKESLSDTTQLAFAFGGEGLGGGVADLPLPESVIAVGVSGSLLVMRIVFCCPVAVVVGLNLAVKE